MKSTPSIAMRLAPAVPALCLLRSALSTAQAQGTAFTYQGQLSSSNSPASGNYDFTFALFNTNSTNTGQIGSTLTNLDVGVTNGLFTVTLDFGSVFAGNATWLAIGVRTNGGAGFTALNPLQELAPAPYAFCAPNARSVAGTNITGTISLAQLPAAVVRNDGTDVTLSGTFSGNGGGLTNLNLTGRSVNSAPGNSAIGSNALADNTSGAQNTANGSLALSANTTNVLIWLTYSGSNLLENLAAFTNTANLVLRVVCTNTLQVTFTNAPDGLAFAFEAFNGSALTNSIWFNLALVSTNLFPVRTNAVYAATNTIPTTSTNSHITSFFIVTGTNVCLQNQNPFNY
jgi:hypothetical protein